MGDIRVDHFLPAPVMTTVCSAPAKAILFGEHAVVYGYPAVAVPLPSIRAQVRITSTENDNIWIEANDIGISSSIDQLAVDSPFRFIVDLFYQHTNFQKKDGILIELVSEIPVASGLGSGAAISTALLKALFGHHRIEYTNNELSNLVYQAERLYHGTPSGIDNTVTCFEQAILFQKGSDIEFLSFPYPYYLVIGNSGFSTPTKQTVAAVKKQFEIDKPGVTAVFEDIKFCTINGLEFLQKGDWERAGVMLSTNHQKLKTLSVSDPRLDKIVSAAIKAGAYGAKMSGGGQGGVVIALVEDSLISKVSEAMKLAGAVEQFSAIIGNR